MTFYVANPLSKNKIRNYANFMRFMFGYSEHEPLNVINIIEHNMFELDEDFVFDIVCDDDPMIVGKEGLSIPGKSKIIFPESVYHKMLKGDGRCNFTACHEIFHYFFHSGISFARDLSEIKPPIYQDPEWQANTFAREFLVPLEALTLEDNPFEIADRYGCSIQVASIQLQQLHDREVRPMNGDIKKH